MYDWKSPQPKDATYWVFDDFPVERLKGQYKGFMGGQKEFTVTDKYMAKKTLTNIGPAIYLFNNAEYAIIHNHLDMAWVHGNSVIIEITESLY